ncbi:MAG: hypothetical protein ACR2ND_05600 [Solirubrobacteraceae bacterium]
MGWDKKAGPISPKSRAGRRRVPDQRLARALEVWFFDLEPVELAGLVHHELAHMAITILMARVQVQRMCDAGDLAAMLVAIGGRQGIDRAPLTSAVMASSVLATSAGAPGVQAYGVDRRAVLGAPAFIDPANSPVGIDDDVTPQLERVLMWALRTAATE